LRGQPDQPANANPKGIVVDRKASQPRELECNAGYGIIALERTSSAHLHRPWRAILVMHNKHRHQSRA
jgi:hypothetical protein